MKANKNKAAVALGRLGGLKGGPARAKTLSPERRSEIARIAGLASSRSPKSPAYVGKISKRAQKSA